MKFSLATILQVKQSKTIMYLSLNIWHQMVKILMVLDLMKSKGHQHLPCQKVGLLLLLTMHRVVLIDNQINLLDILHQEVIKHKKEQSLLVIMNS